jgi:hypothetical protein
MILIRMNVSDTDLFHIHIQMSIKHEQQLKVPLLINLTFYKSLGFREFDWQHGGAKV